MTPIPTTLSTTGTLTLSGTVTVTQTGSVAVQTGGVSSPPILDESRLMLVRSQYGERVSGFIARVHKDWEGIRAAYSLPKDAQIGAYEFVMNASEDSVFVNIISTGTVSGTYDTKILYQFDTTTYKRKFIGIFDFSKKDGRYITRSGTNPHIGVARKLVKDPYQGSAPVPPSTVTQQASTGVVSPANTPSIPTSPVTATGSVITGTVSAVDIDKAYKEKRYLSVISLSNLYLSSNPPTLDILRIRYRTFFIIGKFSESLAEIEKIKNLGKMERAIACDAQVIATYSKNSTLVSEYATICSKR